MSSKTNKKELVLYVGLLILLTIIIVLNNAFWESGKDSKNYYQQNNEMYQLKSDNTTYIQYKEDTLENDVLGILEIEKIELVGKVKEGTTFDILDNYISHIEETAIYDGNIGLAGHNRGYENSYFARLNELETGDTIEYITLYFTRIYEVKNIKIISDDDWSMLQNTEDNRLTLITCVAGQKDKRLCVQAIEIKEE